MQSWTFGADVWTDSRHRNSAFENHRLDLRNSPYTTFHVDFLASTTSVDNRSLSNEASWAPSSAAAWPSSWMHRVASHFIGPDVFTRRAFFNSDPPSLYFRHCGFLLIIRGLDTIFGSDFWLAGISVSLRSPWVFSHYLFLTHKSPAGIYQRGFWLFSSKRDTLLRTY